VRRARSSWLAVAPCDAPLLPIDLVVRLVAGANAAGADAALARVDGRLQPVFAIVATRLQAALAEAVTDGQRALRAWFASVDAQAVDFKDLAAFRNVNSPESRAR
jgi:molybdopterin-guanine dinucleotide biosynthesis protein A